MQLFRSILTLLTLMLFIWGCKKDNGGDENFLLDSAFVGNRQLALIGQTISDFPIDLSIELVFTVPVDQATAANAISLEKSGAEVPVSLQFANGDRNIRVIPASVLSYNSSYTLYISNGLKSRNGTAFAGQELTFTTIGGTIRLTSLTIDGQQSRPFSYLRGISLQPTINLIFSSAVDTFALKDLVSLSGGTSSTPLFTFSQNREEVQIRYSDPLEDWTGYTFTLEAGELGENKETIEETEQDFYTKLDESLKFPLLTDEELLTLIQEQTFKYFWDFGHPVSGMARERNTSGETVTFGGSGFGLMTMIVAVERGFITLDGAIERWKQILSFLETADRFHGAFPHWMNGTTGKVQPFSQRDNGADLVETAFFAQGLLTVREYLKKEAPAQTDLIDQIDQCWQGVEWDWFTKGEDQALYWHWSPDNAWAINLKVSGHNETQIVYILAAASPTHTISKDIYDTGYARSGQMQNGKSFYGIPLPLGSDYGGPLFFTHYSYLGLDPRNLEDQYANYWTQNVNHSRINHAYCKDNPKDYVGYSEVCWGLTASDGDQGYSAHSPNNDRGVITPTAAVSSIPYTPEESMAAIRHFYYVLGDRLWGEYGFYDAFNPTAGWVAGSFLAIDQGPMICMIENYRTGLLWELFMNAPEVKNGLDKLGFTY
ncbi:MAG: glucoamylase family protein [Saprospiraceae bacterium]|nr:Ig-like domain-containing protein [Lewinella sp.]